MSKRKKEDFSFNQWKDFRLKSIKEAKNEKLEEATTQEIGKLADAIARALIGNAKSGCADIQKYRNIIAEYVDKDNFNQVMAFLYRELYDVVVETIKRAQ